MLQATGVHFQYGREILDAPSAVTDVSFTVAPGQIVGLLGQNGSGKSTIAKLIAGILTPQRGELEIDGISVRDRKRRWEARRLVGLVFQNPDDQLITNTLIDEIAFGPENLGLPRDEIQRRVDGAIELLDLAGYRDAPLNELSVGLRQRVAIAGVLAMEPRYLIFDEPTTMLPPQMAQQLIATVHELVRSHGVGAVYITHHMEETIAFDHVMVMSRGSIALEGSPRAVFSQRERLLALGLESPLVMSLARRLRERGYDIAPDCLTPDELNAQVAPYVTRDTDGSAPVQVASNMDRSAYQAQSRPDDAGSAAPLLETRDLSFTYMRGTPLAQQALNGVRVAVQPGTCVAFVGPSRAGKSTLLDCLNAIAKPGKGMVFYKGADTAGPTFDLEALRRAVGVVYQSPDSQLIEEVVGKDVAFGLIRRKIPLDESRRIVRESLEAVGLTYEEFRSRYTYALSGGEKRRVAIAGALAMGPETLILDEPTAGLDPQGRTEFLDLLRRLRDERGLTVLYMTASLDDVVGMADYIYVLDAGSVKEAGAPRQILVQAADLDQLGVRLPAVSRLALSLREVVPGLATTGLDLDQCEANLLARLRPTPSPAQASGGEVAL